MLQQILTGSAVCALLLVAGLSPAQARERQGQAQQPAAEQAPAQAPARTPAQTPDRAPTQAPAQPPSRSTTPESQPAPPSGDVSQAELRQFANAIKELRGIQTEAQTQANQVVQQSGLSSERFAQLLQGQQGASAQPGSGSSSAPSTPQATPQERQRFEQVMTQMNQLQEETVKKMEAAVQEQGLPLERFNQIMAMARQNPQVRQQVQQLLQ